MIKIDGAYLFQIGSELRPLMDIPETERSRVEMWIATNSVRNALLGFMVNSVYRDELGPVKKDADDLAAELAKHDGDIMELFKDDSKVSEWDVKKLKKAYQRFQNVLDATLRSSALYYVSPKGGYNTHALTDDGERIFPADLQFKVPEAVGDIQQATRCVAFELPTAAGFHLHRANESVLRRYWDVVTNGKPRPSDNNMGSYLRELNSLKCGRREVREHLKSIKDFHRNPLMHPEQSLDNVDEAISLLAAIRCSIGYMLAEIPQQNNSPAAMINRQ